jgi:hypothetical protein
MAPVAVLYIPRIVQIAVVELPILIELVVLALPIVLFETVNSLQHQQYKPH